MCSSDLPSVETLGSTTVICTDKTGTLTHGSLTVADVWATGDEAELLTAAVLACEPNPFDPLDVAIVEHARTRGIDVDVLHRSELVADWPFDPARKHVTHAWRVPGRQPVMVTSKGSLEGLVSITSPDDVLRHELDAANRTFADSGMRVIAIAGGERHTVGVDRADDEGVLRLLGLVAFSDPIRDGVPQAIADCRAAGIRVIMITGDHPATAHAVAEGLGLPHTVDGVDLIATGADLDGRDDDGVAELVASANVFARTLGMPNDPVVAVQSLVAGLDTQDFRPIGLGRVNGRYFCFHTGIGFDAAVVKQVERHASLKRWAGHPLFIYAAVSTWATHYDRHHPHFALRFDDGQRVDDGYFTIVLNTNPYTYLGNRPLDLSPAATLDRGLVAVTFRTLDLGTVLRTVNRALRSGGVEANDHLDVRTDLEALDIESPTPFPYQLDGDYLGET